MAEENPLSGSQISDMVTNSIVGGTIIAVVLILGFVVMRGCSGIEETARAKVAACQSLGGMLTYAKDGTAECRKVQP